MASVFYTLLSGGRRYEGSWQDSKHHGFGVLYFAEDNARVRRFYRGEWRDGKRHGFGIMEWQTGARYEGQWEEGKREGKGKQLFANGDVHVGYWQSAKRHGPGCRLFKNGDKLMGTWKNDKRHGLCEYHYAHGRVKEMLYVNGILQENEPLPQQVPSLKILCIETIGKNKSSPAQQKKSCPTISRMLYVLIGRTTPPATSPVSSKICFLLRYYCTNITDFIFKK